MKTLVLRRANSIIQTSIAAFVMAAILSFAMPQAVLAATSGGATIYNTVKVTYTSGTTTLFASANISTTVNTVGALPTVINPAGQAVAAGAAVSYNFLVRSNSNGFDTYNASAHVDTATDVSAATAATMTASFTLWGGIGVGAGAGYVDVPFNTTSNLTAGTSTVYVGTLGQYTVTTITPGSAASTDGSGNLVAEVPTRLILTPIGSAPAITTLNAPLGTQIGEFKSAAVVLGFTAGTPTTAGTDGTYDSHFTITPAAAGASPASMDTVNVRTTVSSPQVTIAKAVSPAGAVNPGATLTYTITVTNTHATASVSDVTLVDPMPAYTTYVANTTRLNGITVNGDGAASPLAAGLLVDSNGSRTPAALATGTLPAGGVAVVVYQVTVD